MGRHTIPQSRKRRVAGGAARIAGFLIVAATAAGQVIPDALIRTILEETSAENALRETDSIARRFRYPDSQGFFDAADHVAARAREYGLQNVRIERFPVERPKWDPAEAELELVAPEARRLSSLETEPLLLAQWSREGEVTAELADAGSDVKGKIALSGKAPAEAWRDAGKRGALAVLCAWQPEFFGRRPQREAVAWGEAPENALAFMISPRMGDELREMLKRGGVTLRMRARVKRTEPGEIGQVMGEIPGELAGHDVVLVSHLDHQKQGANDNASGSGTLLEVLRTATRLIASGKIPKPRRTLRFWWSTEIRSEQAYFRKYPEDAKKIALAVVLDQAGGERGAENHFIAIANPDRLPSYSDDLIRDLIDFFARQYAPPERKPEPLSVAPGGSEQSLNPAYFDYAPLSDHVAFSARGVDIPAISLAVPSLNVIHTSLDTVDRLDPTWLKRSALATLAPALFVANAGPAEAEAMLEATFRRAVARVASAADRQAQLEIEKQRLASVARLDSAVDVAGRQARLGSVVQAIEGRPR